MDIDVNGLIRKKNISKSIDLIIESQDIFIGNSEVKSEEDINFTGILYSNDDIILLDGKVEGLLTLLCSRCLEGFKYPLDIEIHEKFTVVPNDEDDTVTFVDSDKTNLNEIIENNILISLPIKKLCNEDCKGLCQNCGSNLNKQKCNCDNEIVDPRLAKLKDLFLTE